jgi:excisionase family DNA binding protein
MDLNQTAQLLGVSVVTCRRLIARRALAHRKIGGLIRIDVRDLEDYLARTHVRAIASPTL